MEKINVMAIAKKSRNLNVPEFKTLLTSDTTKFMCWGVEKFEPLYIETTENVRLVVFSVNGIIHKGLVYISVNGSDLFNIYLTTYEGELVRTIEDLYFDMLVDSLDEAIESGVVDYKNEVFKATVQTIKSLNKNA